MADQPQNIVLVMLRDIRAKQDGHPAYLQRMEARSGDVEKHLYDKSYEAGRAEVAHDQDHRRRQRDRRSAGIHAAAGLRGRWCRDSAVLLSRAPVDRRQLPHVPRRTRGLAEAGRELRLGRARLPSRPQGRAARGQDSLAHGQEGARRGDGVPAHQPSPRLSDLRPGRGMRPAGPGHGLWRQLLALQGEQARGRGQVSRRPRQDLDEPLHPVYPLRAVRDRSRRRAGTGRHRPRRGHGDHDLSVPCDDIGAAGQCGRPLPGGSTDGQALRLRRPALGAGQDRVGRRPGRRWFRDPRRHPRPRGDAHPAARQRGRERGVDFRQDPPRGRRPAGAAARPALCAGGRAAPAGVMGAGFPGHRRKDEDRPAAAASAPSPAISARSRRCSRSSS